MITAILLAAGQSKRVPTKNKLLIKYRKKLLINHILGQLIKSKIQKIIIVLGHEYFKVRKFALKSQGWDHVIPALKELLHLLYSPPKCAHRSFEPSHSGWIAYISLYYHDFFRGIELFDRIYPYRLFGGFSYLRFRFW